MIYCDKHKLIAFILSFVLLTAVLYSCRKSEEIYITWTNAEGELIAYEEHSESYDPSIRELPTDTDDYHYTGWSVFQNGKNIVCVATRVSKIKVEWVFDNGTVIETRKLPLNEIEASLIPLPKNSEKWTYTEWHREDAEDVITFTAKMTPNKDYFSGNVFQLIMKDENGEAISSGSGFVINDDGWFITNNHVMEQGASAVAFFDIRDESNGNRYTQLNILGGIYNSSEKDIFIGKLEGYSKIKDYYKKIEFTENYSFGQRAYTVGYPNSSVELKINSGKILEEYSDIYDKINGIYYVLSDSYIAPGSSGGILINDNFEVIGITTIGIYADDNKLIYEAGGSVPTFVFSAFLNDLDDNELKTLKEIYTQGE